MNSPPIAYKLMGNQYFMAASLSMRPTTPTVVAADTLALRGSKSIVCIFSYFPIEVRIHQVVAFYPAKQKK